MASRDRPSFVRGVEFEAIPRIGDRCELSHKKRLTIGGINADKEGKTRVLDSGLAGLLFYALPGC
jgi:hypothetical protein